MKYIVIFVLLPFLAFSQNLPTEKAGKGVSPIASSPRISSGPTAGQTYAVVVGISDYLDKNIPDLQFANKDAEAFAEWLQSAAGGSIPNDKIQLLSNGSATNAAIYMALNWLMEECKEGDQAIIYFSGHGDVETRTLRQNGFLLGHDTPAAVYMAGAVSLGYLQDVITTLSEKNKTKVLIITDACHAGKLAGSSIGGSQITGANLAKQFAGETKILSCQPNEFSIEGEQWGGGRGVFSFHLMDGLTGMADKNGDGVVNLNEIDRYLGDKVSPETAPQPQTPFTVGDRNTSISYIDAAALTQLKQTKANASNLLAQINSKGLEEELLAKSDSLTRSQYIAFKKALTAGNLLEPQDTCAWYYYQSLVGKSTLEPLHRLMRRNLAVALLNEVQKALNALLANDPEEANQWQWNPEKYRQNPEYLSRVMELLGTDHPLNKSLQSKKLYFEAYVISRVIGDQVASESGTDSLKKEAKFKLQQAIGLEPGAAYLYFSIGKLYEQAMAEGSMAQEDGVNGQDSLVLWGSRAIERSPSWLLPYLDIANQFFYISQDTTQGLKWLEKATVIDSGNYILQQYKAFAYLTMKKFESVEMIARKMINQRPEIMYGYSLLAMSYIAGEQKYDEAERLCNKVLEADSTNIIWGYSQIGWLYSLRRNFQKAKHHLLKGLESGKCTPAEETILLLNLVFNAELAQNYVEAMSWADSTINQTEDDYFEIQALTTKAHILLEQGNYAESETLLKYALTLDPTPNPYYIMDKAYLAMIAEKRGEISTAEDFFKQAEAMGSYWEGGVRRHFIFTGCS